MMAYAAAVDFIVLYGRKWLACIHVYAIGVYCLLSQLFTWKNLQCHWPKKSSLVAVNGGEPARRGFYALVTGVSAGSIGVEVAGALLIHGWTVAVVIFRETDLPAVVARFRDALRADRLIVFIADLSELRDVKRLVIQVQAAVPRIHLFISCAATMMPPFYLSSDSTEQQWAVNFRAPMVLCESLLPLVLKAAADDHIGRVIALSSSTLYAGNLSPDWFKKGGSTETCPKRKQRTYSSHLSYANSKLALSLYIQQLAERFNNRPGFVACSLHPGVVQTRLYRFVSWLPRCLFFESVLARWTMRTPSEAANDVLSLAFNQKSVSGGYYENGVEKQLPMVEMRVLKALRTHVEKLRRKLMLAS